MRNDSIDPPKIKVGAFRNWLNMKFNRGYRYYVMDVVLYPDFNILGKFAKTEQEAMSLWSDGKYIIELGTLRVVNA